MAMAPALRTKCFILHFVKSETTEKTEKRNKHQNSSTQVENCCLPAESKGGGRYGLLFLKYLSGNNVTNLKVYADYTWVKTMTKNWQHFLKYHFVFFCFLTQGKNSYSIIVFECEKPPRVQVFEHLVPKWWCCFGRF